MTKPTTPLRQRMIEDMAIRNMSPLTQAAYVRAVAAGRPGLITGEMLKPGAALIDIGINQVTSADGGTAVVGDADFASRVEVAGWITPVPGGVGLVTAATLMRNAVTAARLQHDAYRAMVEARPE